MSVTVKFFANLRETTGLSSTSIDFVEGMTLSDVWSAATNGMEMPAKFLMAVNMEYESNDVEVKDNDEVAYFPMVSGG